MNSVFRRIAQLSTFAVGRSRESAARTAAISLHQKRSFFHLPEERRAFARVSEEDISTFRDIVGEKGVIFDDEDALLPFNQDWQGIHCGKSSLALLPTSTKELSEIMHHCYLRGLAVVPQGGNTGLVIGGVPMFDEVIVSLKRMNKILGFDDASQTVQAEAGVILQSLEEYANERGATVPVDLGAKGSCTIGGNAATNAGGVHVIQYGSLRNNILGLEAVLANGQVLDLMTSVKKDNTGYDLKQLFIGSEGSLGLITKLSVACWPKPIDRSVALVACENFESVLKVLNKCRGSFGGNLSAFEFFDHVAHDLVHKHFEKRKDFFEESYPFYALIEISSAKEAEIWQETGSGLMDEQTRVLEGLLTEGDIADAFIATSETEARHAWEARELIPECAAREGKVYKYDVSVETGSMYKLTEDVRKAVGDKAQVMGYGHVGDGNVHINVVAPEYSKELLSILEPFIYERVANTRGSVSAEHGIGTWKKEYLRYTKTDTSIEVMRTIKRAMDPKGLLNPYKIFD